MKTLENINQEFLNVNGKPIPSVDGDLTFKTVMIQCVGGLFTSTNIKDNILARKVGQKIYDSKKDLDLEDAEFELLCKSVKEVVKKSHFTAIVIGPLCEYLSIEE